MSLHPEDVQKLQWLYDVVRGIDGDNIRWSGNSLYIGSGGAGGDTPGTDWKPRQFRVVSEENDYLVCVPYNSVTEEAGTREYKVAKPVGFRGDTELWGVYPPYVDEVSVIWAAPVRANGATDGDDLPISLVDMNFDGRRGDGFWGKVTGSTADGTNKWTYAITEQEPTSGGYADLTGGRSITGARNATETNNDGTGVQGNSIDIDGTVFDDNSDLEIQPVQGEPVVWVTQYQTSASTYEYRFEYVSAVDGECA